MHRIRSSAARMLAAGLFGLTFGARVSGTVVFAAVISGVGCSHSTNQAPATSPSQAISAIKFDPDPIVMRKGDSKKVKATAVAADGTKSDVSADAKWTSENAATATVDSSGNVVGANVGATNIDATYRGTKGQVSVTVTP